MNSPPVESDQIVSGDAGDGRDTAFTRRRVIRSVQELDELASDDRTGGILPAANPFDGLQLGQLNPCRLKGGPPNEACKNLEPPLQVLAEHIEHRTKPHRVTFRASRFTSLIAPPRAVAPSRRSSRRPSLPTWPLFGSTL